MHVPSWSQAQALSALAALGPHARAEIIEALRVNRFPNPKSEGRISHAACHNNNPGQTAFSDPTRRPNGASL